VSEPQIPSQLGLQTAGVANLQSFFQLRNGTGPIPFASGTESEVT